MLKNKIKELALKLHSFPSNDRSWILGNLNDIERNKMEALLIELDSINGSVNSELVSEALNSYLEFSNKENETKISSDLDSIIKSLDSKSDELIHNVIKDLEPCIIAVILESHNWKWKEQFNNLLSINKKLLVTKHQAKDVVAVKDLVRHSILSTVDVLADPTIKNSKVRMQELQLFFEAPKYSPGSDAAVGANSWK